MRAATAAHRRAALFVRLGIFGKCVAAPSAGFLAHSRCDLRPPNHGGLPLNVLGYSCLNPALVGKEGFLPRYSGVPRCTYVPRAKAAGGSVPEATILRKQRAEKVSSRQRNGRGRLLGPRPSRHLREVRSG
jgi:hypothetical protein